VHKTGADHDVYVAAFNDFYTFNNDSPLKPFELDIQPLLKKIPLQLESFHDWASRQDWTAIEGDIGSVSG